MNDDSKGDAGPRAAGGAVARLTEALASAQAVARDDALGRPDAGAPPTAPRADDPLRSRIDELPMADSDSVDLVDAPMVGDPRSETPGAPSKRRRLWPLYVIMSLLILAVPALVVVGYHIASTSTAGEVLSGHSNPSAPGYTALVEPTPVALVMQMSDAGVPQGLTVLSLSGPDQHGGAVLAAPVDARVSRPRPGIETFSAAMKLKSSAIAGKVIGSELGLGFDDVIELTDSDLTRLVAPVAPLQIDNPEAVTTPDGTTISAGPVTLSADQVPQYLAASDVGNTVSGLLARQQLVWNAWIARIKQVGVATAIPGETASGIGHYLAGLAAGKLQSASFPLLQTTGANGQSTVAIDHDPAMLLVANAVPLPVGALPGDRATVALLNGTGPEAAPTAVIQRLTYAGAQISTVGNAASFDHGQTTLAYSNDRAHVFALAMARQLGVGRVVPAPTTDTSTDVVVIMGRDLLDHPPALLTVEDIGGQE